MMQVVNANEMYGPILPISFLKNKGLSLGAKNVFSMLFNLAKEKKFCYPSQKFLAEELECSIGSIRNYLGELEEKKMIRVEHKNARVSVYHLLIQIAKKIDFGIKKETTPQCEDRSEPIPQKTTSQETEERSKKNSTSHASKEFFEIWELYPKKINQKFAMRSWELLKKKDLLPSQEVLIKSIKHFMETDLSWQKSEGRFIPQLSSFLEDMRWLSLEIEKTKPTRPAVSKLSKEDIKLEEEEKIKWQQNRVKAEPLFKQLITLFPNASTLEQTIAYGKFLCLYNEGVINEEIIHVPVGKFTNVLEWLKTLSSKYNMKRAA